MQTTNKKYNLPPGYSLLQTTLRSNGFLNNPIAFISKSMDVFSDTYSAALGIKKKLIITQDPQFINYILKENHRNYSKSELATKRAVEFFGKGLLFSNGDDWLKQRRLIQPAFHKEKLQGLYNIMIRSIESSLEKFPVGKNVDIYPAVHRLSFTVLLESLFDVKIPVDIIDELSNIFTQLQDFLIKDINQPIRRFFYPVTNSKSDQIKKAQRLREIFGTIIVERTRSGNSSNDLLDLLLNSKYEDTGETMTNDQIIDEVLILIFAGHETTANTLSWLLYLVSTHQAICDELTNSFGNSSVEQSVSNLNLNATINEVMRLYPAAWMTERVALEDDKFEKYSYPKGTIIIPFFFGLHRDKTLWKDELQFNPQRFIVDDKLLRSKNYFPFGAGPRMCIGNNFAMAEMSFFIFSFLKRFRVSSTGEIPNMKPLITLRPEKVMINVENREV